MSQLPIADYALLSDCRSAALVSREGSIDWLCFPRFDGPSVFGRLLDDDAGFWSIRPAGTDAFETTRRYVHDTLVLESRFTTAGGSVTLTDALAVGRNERGHDLGAGAVGAVLRQVIGVKGSVDLELVYMPRPEYGLVSPLMDVVEGGVDARGGADVLALSSSVPLDTDEFTARAAFTIAAGESQSFALHHRSTSQEQPRRWTEMEIRDRLADTAEAWRTWSSLHQGYDGPWRDVVRTSGRVLYGLTYFPTGAIVAAPTTSLPEPPGGARNWDYRYTWIRDASFTLQALWVAACPHEANKFFDYLAGTAASQVRQGADLQIMFGIGGEHDLSERELGHLAGWRASAPVRVGNGAWNQRQLDVYGELLDAACRLPEQLDRIGPVTRRFLADLADTAAAHWQDADHGIWEIRGEPRQFLYSTLMCWVALDRAIVLADRLDALDRVSRWKITRDEIAEAIMSRGWNEQVGAFDPVVRVRRARRLEPHDGDRRLHPGRPPPDAGDDRRRRDPPHRRAGAGLPVPFRRRVAGRGRHVPPVYVLARPRTGTRRAARPGARHVHGRRSRGERRRTPVGAGRPAHRGAPRELPPGV